MNCKHLSVAQFLGVFEYLIILFSASFSSSHMGQPILECLYQLVFETLGEMLGPYNAIYLLRKCYIYLFLVIIISRNFFKTKSEQKFIKI